MSAITLRPVHKITLGGAATAAALGVYLLRKFDPNAVDSPFPQCTFHVLTGLYCPACGSTRALYALVHADLPGALAMNPLLVLVLPLLPLLLAWHAGWQPRALRPLIGLISRPNFWFVLLPVYWVARNLPWLPFSWLAPG